MSDLTVYVFLISSVYAFLLSAVCVYFNNKIKRIKVFDTRFDIAKKHFRLLREDVMALNEAIKTLNDKFKRIKEDAKNPEVLHIGSYPFADYRKEYQFLFDDFCNW